MKKRSYVYFMVAILLLLVPLAGFALWIHMFDDAAPFEEVRNEYLSYYPESFRTGNRISWINILLLVMALILFPLAIRRNQGLKSISSFLIALAALLLFLQLWTLM